MSLYYKFNCGIGTAYPSKLPPSNIQFNTKRIELMNSIPDFTVDNVYDLDLVYNGYMIVNTPTNEHIYLDYELNNNEYSGSFDIYSIKPLIISASGGSVGPFRWIIIATTGMGGGQGFPICAYDFGSSITLNDGENLKITFKSNKVYTVK